MNKSCETCRCWNGSECKDGRTAAFGCDHWRPLVKSISFEEYMKNAPSVLMEGYESIGKTTSKGNQDKWYLSSSSLFVKGAFFYEDRFWKDYICEEIAYSLGMQLGLDVLQTVVYKLKFPGQTAEKPCSVSRSFLAEDEVHIPLGRIIDRFDSRSFSKEYFRLSTQERITRILQVYQDYCGLNARQYLMDTIGLDYLIGNEDRHLNNLGVVYNESQENFRFPPIFDNGLSLFEHDTRYASAPLTVCIRSMEGKPFNTDLKKAYHIAKEVLGLEGLHGTVILDKLVFPTERALQYLLWACKDIGLQVSGEGCVILEG